MSTVTLQAGIKFKLENSIYIVQKRLPNLRVEVLDENFNETKIFSYNQLSEYLSKGLLSFEVIGKNTILSSENINISHQFEDIEHVKHKEQAIFRYEVIKPLLEINTNKKNAVEERVRDVNSWISDPLSVKKNLNDSSYYSKISVSTVYRWLKDYTESNGNFHSLFPAYYKSGGKNKSRSSDKVQDIINETVNEVYLNRQRLTIKDLRYEVIYRIEEYNKYSNIKLKCPSYVTFTRYIAKIPEFELIAKRRGYRDAKNQFAQLGNGVSVSYPLERVEIDHTPIDVILVDENRSYIGRPYLILAIDKFTRMPVGFSIGLSNGVGWPEVMQCIHHILTDKSYIKKAYPFIKNTWNAFGVPTKIVVDNGLEFKNSAMRDASYQLGFVLEFCPPKTPQWKGSIERYFGSLNTGLIHTLPGTTRSNPTKLALDENPVKNACITFTEFLALINIWIIDCYNQDLNKGAGGIPSKLWDQAIQAHPVSWPTNTSELSILLGRTAYRKISPRGIALNSLNYNSNELYELFLKFNAENKGKEQNFKVKYDPSNIGHLSVYDHLISNKWVKVECTNIEYAENLSEWEHKEIVTYARNNHGIVDEIELSKAKRLIRDMIQNYTGYTQKHKARVNKVNSATEIQKSINNNSTVVNPLDNSINKQPTNTCVSDIGYNIDINEVIITKGTKTKEVHQSVNNVVQLGEKSLKSDKSKSKNKDKKDKHLNKKVKDSSIINFDDFSGFGVYSTYTGDED